MPVSPSSKAGGNEYHPSAVALAPAVIKRKVFVLLLSSYGDYQGNINTLNASLMNLYSQASVYHGYKYVTRPQATFLGQDGQSYAGAGCVSSTQPNNAHVRLTGLKTDVMPVSYRLEDGAGGGLWATPCNPQSNWLLYVTTPTPGQADLYFRPFRSAPNGTVYAITVQYSDGSSQSVSVLGTAIAP